MIKVLNGGASQLTSILSDEVQQVADIQLGHAVVDADVAIERKAFEQLLTGGYKPMVREGDKARVLDTYEPGVDIIMIRPLVGG